MIFVTGCARSGTSLTMAVLQACGANLGTVNKLNESTRVRDGLVKPYLRSIGGDPLGQHPLPNTWGDDPDWREKVLDALPPEPSATKIIKGVLFWQLWVRHFPEAKWVIVYRDPEAIARSCVRTRFMKGKQYDGWIKWAQEYHARCARLYEHADAIRVAPDDAVRGDVEAYRPMVEHCGLTWDAEAVRAVIDPSRWHG